MLPNFLLEPDPNNRFLAMFQSDFDFFFLRGFVFVIQNVTRLPFTMTRTSHAIVVEIGR